jgi:putative flippase GtrA
MTLWSGNSSRGLFLRYILVAGFNAGAGFGIYSLLLALLRTRLPLQAILLLSYVYPVVVGFLGNKHLVFRSDAGWQREHLKFMLVFCGCIAVNDCATVVLVSRCRMGPWLAQAIATVISALVGFLGNYAFTFRHPAVSQAVAREGRPAGPAPAATERPPGEQEGPRGGRADHPASGSR